MSSCWPTPFVGARKVPSPVLASLSAPPLARTCTPSYRPAPPPTHDSGLTNSGARFGSPPPIDLHPPTHARLWPDTAALGLDLAECYICYDEGEVGNPLINPCQCAGSVKYVHLNCLQRWIQPEGSSAVNTHCPVCKVRYPEKTQAMMVRPPAILLESWSNHRTLKLRHWVSFAQHGSASLGRFVDHNDVVIPDHSVSGEHALIVHGNDEFWLHDRESSNGSFIRLCAPLRLTFGESLHLKMGKSLLCLQAKRSRWLRLRMRLNLLRLGGGSSDTAGGSAADCWPPATLPRTARPAGAAGAEQLPGAAAAAGAGAVAMPLAAPPQQLPQQRAAAVVAEDASAADGGVEPSTQPAAEDA